MAARSESLARARALLRLVRNVSPLCGVPPQRLPPALGREDGDAAMWTTAVQTALRDIDRSRYEKAPNSHMHLFSSSSFCSSSSPSSS
jgi:hypothetical protein